MFLEIQDIETIDFVDSNVVDVVGDDGDSFDGVQIFVICIFLDRCGCGSEP